MSQFIYLLNAFEQASQADNPANLGYGTKRAQLIEYVTRLEDALALRPEGAERLPRDWMAKNVNTFASFWLQQYEKTGSLRESMMFAFVKTFDGEDPCQRCYNCGATNRLNGQLVHASGCFVGRREPQKETP